ncbi:MAG: HAMP domain-containing protein [Deltaproteobacteria bacterium]
MNINLLKTLRENFSVRAFIVFAILISIISFSFTTFLIRQESKSLTERAISKGTLLATVLAHTSRIGVFSENEELLRGPVEAVIEQEGVLEASIFNLDGKLLRKGRKGGNRNDEIAVSSSSGGQKEVFRKLRESMHLFYLEQKNTFQFWATVTSRPVYAREESLFLEDNPLKRKDNITGFVQIILDKKILKQKLAALLLNSSLIGVAFLLIGCGITYLVVRGITKPLNKLTEGVRALGRGTDVEDITVDTEDEIGKLAGAFNDMSQSLKTREEALRNSEQRLRSLSSQLIKTQEKERSRLSKELHDELGQALALLKHRVRHVQRELSETHPSLSRDCEQTGHYIDQIIENVRRLSKELSPSILQDLGLSSALRWLIRNFANQYSLETSFEIDDIDQLFSQEDQTNLYRISQEALTNIIKHAEASHVSFVVKKNENTVSMVIEDDGKGCEITSIRSDHSVERGLGLDTMEERARMLGALLEIQGRAGEGTRIALTLFTERGGMH